MNDESVLGSGIGDLTVNRESRLERSGSASEVEDPLQFTKSFRKSTLKSSREMIGLMEVSFPLTFFSHLAEGSHRASGEVQRLSSEAL